MDMIDRRTKTRFQIRRELRYKLRGKGGFSKSGVGSTVDISSRGVAFSTDSPLVAEAPVELSISWPALLDDVHPIRLTIVGRILRVRGRNAVCTVDKYEFRTQGASPSPAPAEGEVALQPWAIGLRTGAARA
jgi:hypothetical protein